MDVLSRLGGNLGMKLNYGVNNERTKSIKDVRAAIGTRVYWDAPSSQRYYGMERSGILTEAIGKNVCISGNWLWRSHLNNFRTTSKEVSNIEVRDCAAGRLDELFGGTDNGERS